MKRNYIGVRKMVWDRLWHALWCRPGGAETYDRVTKDQAEEILTHL